MDKKIIPKYRMHLRFTALLTLTLFMVYQVAYATPGTLMPQWANMSVILRTQLPASEAALDKIKASVARRLGLEKATGGSGFVVLQEKSIRTSQNKPIFHQGKYAGYAKLSSPETKALPVKSHGNFPDKKVHRIIKGIEYKFDQEKYKAFKIFSEPSTNHRGANFDLAEITFIQKSLEAYQNALKRASARAESRRMHIMKSLSSQSVVFRVTHEQKSTIRLLFSSFLNVITPIIGNHLIIFVEKWIPSDDRYIPSAENLLHIRQFLEKNLTETGLPLSYKAGKDFWEATRSPMDRVDSVLERTLVEYSVNIYDAAVWQVALAAYGDKKSMTMADKHTDRMLSGTSGRLLDIRAYGPLFKYGDKKKVLKRDNAFFFRIIADEYIQEDPLGENLVDGFPNFNTVHHEDWKPIMGEQAWAAIIGPIQVAYEKYGANIPLESPEMKLALSILPALEAMQSPTGGVYHAPDGTHGKNPRDISNENNFSLYSALRMLYEVLKDQDKELALRVKSMMVAQENYFKKYGYDYKDGIFFQGGFSVDNQFVPTRIFAVDCQTWGIASLGPAWIDENIGEGTAYKIWKNTVRRGGYFDERGVLRGVGFTDDHRILTVEWTCGAILAAQLMADYYRNSHPDWAAECLRDAVSMRFGIENVKTRLKDGSVAYLYANNRYFIPFGWWANPLPSLVSSAWVILLDNGYNPFILGGGSGVSPYRY